MTEGKTPIGFQCNFCVEVHPTLRAICNHLRKHVQYGEVKEGHVKVNPPTRPPTNPEFTAGSDCDSTQPVLRSGS